LHRPVPVKTDFLPGPLLHRGGSRLHGLTVHILDLTVSIQVVRWDRRSQILDRFTLATDLE
jgi:hypothetical protein